MPKDALQLLRDARGKDKLDVLLEAPDPLAAIAAIPAEDLYLAVLEIGRDDAAEIITLASVPQFRIFVDLACWPRSDEGPRAPDVLAWLRLAREAGGNSDTALARYQEKLAGLDLELLMLVLKSALTVHDLQEEEDPDIADDASIYRTPEGRYLVEVRSDYPAMKQLLDDLFERDTFGTARLLEALRWEVPTELEEVARKWRDGRLRDLGFPGFEEAISFYARPAARPQAAVAPSAGTALVAPTRALLDAALELLRGEELQRAEEGIVYAANSALVANAVSLDDASEVHEQLVQARATLSLGLELLSNGDPAEAAQVLATMPVRTIFQTAMGESYRLQARARKIAITARLPQAQAATLLDLPLAEVVDAFARKRPLFHAPESRRPRVLMNRAEIARAEALLDEAEATVALLHALGLAPAVLGPLADAAGLGAAVVRASDAVRALADSQLRGSPLSLTALAGDDRPRSPEVVQKAHELISDATAKLDTPAATRAAERLRTILAR